MNLETVKITKVFVSDKSKDGKPFVSKNGKPFWKIGILTDKYPKDWYSALAFSDDAEEKNLVEGQEVKIIFDNSGQYKNFQLPSRLDQLEERVAVLEANSRLGLQNKPLVPDIKEIEISNDDLPF